MIWHCKIQPQSIAIKPEFRELFLLSLLCRPLWELVVQPRSTLQSPSPHCHHLLLHASPNRYNTPTVFLILVAICILVYEPACGLFFFKKLLFSFTSHLLFLIADLLDTAMPLRMIVISSFSSVAETALFICSQLFFLFFFLHIFSVFVFIFFC